MSDVSENDVITAREMYACEWTDRVKCAVIYAYTFRKEARKEARKEGSINAAPGAEY